MRKSVLLLASLVFAVLLASGVAWAATIDCTGGECTGTPQYDHMEGSAGRDIIYALKGNDDLWGLGGSDEVYGFDGDDYANGGYGLDKVAGGDGSDRLLDGPEEEFAKDTVKGGRGIDYLETWNVPNAADVVDCGGGKDRARVDKEDTVINCEWVQLMDENGNLVFESEPPPSTTRMMAPSFSMKTAE